jgi:predicted O-linked N-acetylglucosamine transferase (SPINDLY family)
MNQRTQDGSLETDSSDSSNTAEGLYAQGIAAYQKKAYAEAEKLFTRALAEQPDAADAWHMRGICCLMLNRLGEAETFIRKAIEIRKVAAFYANLGAVLTRAQKFGEATAAYRESLALNPGNTSIRSSLGNLFKNLGEWQQAEALYRKAPEDDAFALADLGGLLLRRGSYVEAEQVLRRSLALNPAIASATETLGAVLEQTGRIDEAVPLFKATGRWGQLARSLRKQAAWRYLANADAAIISNLQRGQPNTVAPWTLLNLPDLTPQLQRQAALDFAINQFGAALQQRPRVNAVARNGPLRIGYLSADFYDHATMRLLAGVLEAHDPARVEVHLLSINRRAAKDSDAYAKRIAAMPAAFHDLAQLSDAQAAQRIVKIAPHLLIDLKGYTADARPSITVMRPAPVIVNWLGYPGTLGHPRLADYIIGDPVVTPPGHAQDFSETLALMPHCYQPNDRSRPLDAAASRAEAGLPESGFVFCSFNQFIKINPSTFDIWCRLLAATPGSVLWLLDGHKPDTGQAHLRREARQRGIADERLVFAPVKAPPAHLARLRLADLALDTFPYNSHTTASDALWAGVPLVTRIGQTFASRVAASLLTAHGLPELIAQDDEAYFALALSLANEPDKLRGIRQKLDAARLASPLFDTVGFTRDLERLYEAIWRQQSVPRNERTALILPP